MCQEPNNEANTASRRGLPGARLSGSGSALAANLTWAKLTSQSIPAEAVIGFLWRFRHDQIECPGQRKTHASYLYGLDCYRWVFAGQSADRALLPATGQREHGRI